MIDANSKKILITGSKGMVGEELRFRLLYDHEIHTLDLKDGQDLRDCDLDYDVDIISFSRKEWCQKKSYAPKRILGT